MRMSYDDDDDDDDDNVNGVDIQFSCMYSDKVRLGTVLCLCW